jgi:tetratricopeptide (TPR) repeat protein
VNEAYAKFAELNRMAPNSPAVVAMLQKLNSIRAQEEIGRQQQANAKAKFDEGMALFNQKKFAESIPLFSESFSLNPNSEETAKYLKFARQEQQNAEDAKAAQARQRKVTATSTQQAHATTTAPLIQPHTTATGGDGSHTAANNTTPVQFTTFFNSPFNDGYVIVKVGADIILREQLFTESRFLHRKSPRAVNVTTSLTPKNTDIEISVVVPSQQIQEHHSLLRVNLQPGSAHRLTITADAASKKFDYSLN